MGECCSRDASQKPPVDKAKSKTKTSNQTTEASAELPGSSKRKATEDKEEPKFELTQDDELPTDIKKDYKVKMRQGERSTTSKVTVRSFYEIGSGYAVLDSAYR
jgi:hypothetical protein